MVQGTRASSIYFYHDIRNIFSVLLKWLKHMMELLNGGHHIQEASSFADYAKLRKIGCQQI
jgi:hypothetical protein